MAIERAADAGESMSAMRPIPRHKSTSMKCAWGCAFDHHANGHASKKARQRAQHTEIECRSRPIAQVKRVACKCQRHGKCDRGKYRAARPDAEDEGSERRKQEIEEPFGRDRPRWKVQRQRLRNAERMQQHQIGQRGGWIEHRRNARRHRPAGNGKRKHDEDDHHQRVQGINAREPLLQEIAGNRCRS